MGRPGEFSAALLAVRPGLRVCLSGSESAPRQEKQRILSGWAGGFCCVGPCPAALEETAGAPEQESVITRTTWRKTPTNEPRSVSRARVAARRALRHLPGRCDAPQRRLRRAPAAARCRMPCRGTGRADLLRPAGVFNSGDTADAAVPRPPFHRRPSRATTTSSRPPGSCIRHDAGALCRGPGDDPCLAERAAGPANAAYELMSFWWTWALRARRCEGRHQLHLPRQRSGPRASSASMTSRASAGKVAWIR